MKTREPGYYWVKCFGEWLVAEYDGRLWPLICDVDIDEIDERRITRPE